MILLSLPYFLIALYLGGSAFWDGEIARGFAIIGASYLALGAGISVRSLFKKRFNPDFDARKQVPVMVILAVLMLAASKQILGLWCDLRFPALAFAVELASLLPLCLWCPTPWPWTWIKRIFVFGSEAEGQ